MALTRPKIWDLDTNIEYFMDPITVLHQGSGLANVDVGFIFNRANGLVSNVALYWSESAQSLVAAYTSASGATNTNIAATSYANITVGNISANGFFWANGTVFSSGSGTGTGITYTASGTAPASPHNGDIWFNTTSNVIYTYTYDTVSSYWLDTEGPSVAQANLTTTITVANVITTNGVYWSNGAAFSSGGTYTGGYVAGQATFGSNLIANSAAASTSTTTGALVVVGGAGISGTATVGNITTTSGLFWANGVAYNAQSASTGKAIAMAMVFGG